MAVNDADIDAFLDADDEQIDAFLDAPTDVPAASAQQQQGPGLMEQITGPAIRAIEGAVPFARPALKAIGGLGKQAVSGYQEIENLAIQNQGADSPQAALAGGMKKAADFLIPQNEAQAAIAIGGEAFGPAIPSIAKSLRPAIAKAGARLMRATAGVPEKYGAAVLNNPDILTKAETREVASQVYKSAIGSLKGAADYLQSKTGKLLMKSGSAEDLVNDVAGKFASQAQPSLQEVLAARQANEFLLTAAKFGNPEQRANLRNLMEFKKMADDYLESGLPGFKDASRGYFEANAKEAFSTLLPQNKNLSPNVLRSLGGLAMLSSGAWMNAPYMMVAAIPFSPKAIGVGIRAGNQAIKLASSYQAQFAARVAAMRAAAEEPK